MFQKRAMFVVLTIMMLLSLVLTGTTGAAGNARAVGIILSTDSAASTLVLYQNKNVVQTFVVDADAVIINSSRAALTFADLAAGQGAQITYVTTDGVLHARKVLVNTPPRPQRIVYPGYVVAIDSVATSLTVRNQFGELTFVVTDTTTYQGVAAFAELEVNQYVTVQAAWQGDAWLATRVAVAQAPRIDLLGTVSAIDTAASTFTLHTVVGDYAVLVDAATVIKYSGQAITLADLVVDSSVKVRMVWLPDNTWLAKQVNVLQIPTLNCSGTVTEKLDSQFTVQATDGSVTFVVNGQTVYTQDNVVVSYDLVTVGATVRVRAVKQADGTWLAKKVCIVPPPTVSYSGVVTAKGTSDFSVLTVGGTFTFTVGADTTFEKDDQATSFDVLVVGDHVRVKATQQVDGTWLAKQVEILSIKTTVRGTVTEKLEAQFTVRAGRVLYIFTVNDATVYEKQGVAAPTYADLAANDTVVVTATQQADGTWLATRIKIVVKAGPTDESSDTADAV